MKEHHPHIKESKDILRDFDYINDIGNFKHNFGKRDIRMEKFLLAGKIKSGDVPNPLSNIKFGNNKTLANSISRTLNNSVSSTEDGNFSLDMSPLFKTTTPTPSF